MSVFSTLLASIFGRKEKDFPAVDPNFKFCPEKSENLRHGYMLRLAFVNLEGVAAMSVDHHLKFDEEFRHRLDAIPEVAHYKALRASYDEQSQRLADATEKWRKAVATANSPDAEPRAVVAAAEEAMTLHTEVKKAVAAVNLVAEMMNAKFAEVRRTANNFARQCESEFVTAAHQRLERRRAEIVAQMEPLARQLSAECRLFGMAQDTLRLGVDEELLGPKPMAAANPELADAMSVGGPAPAVSRAWSELPSITPSDSLEPAGDRMTGFQHV
jgi:hypothetical protein